MILGAIQAVDTKQYAFPCEVRRREIRKKGRNIEISLSNYENSIVETMKILWNEWKFYEMNENSTKWMKILRNDWNNEEKHAKLS